MSSRGGSGPSDTKIFVGKLSKKVKRQDLEDEFAKFGKIREIEMRNSFAFIEFDHPKDAEDAVEEMNNRSFLDSRITVQFQGAHKKGGSRGPTPNDVCYNCGKKGHW